MKGVVFMLSHDERLLELEQGYKMVNGAIKGINHFVTQMYGVMGKQEEDIKELKISIRSIDSRLTTVESRLTTVESRLSTVENRLTMVEDRLSAIEGRLSTIESRLDTFEQNMDEALVAVHTKLDQMLRVLSALTQR